MQASLHQDYSNVSLKSQRPVRVTTYTLQTSTAASDDKAAQQKIQQQQQEIIQKLQARDRDVRAHEAAHVAAGRPYVISGPSYTFQVGPDGRDYAIGGSVGLDVSEEKDPEDTLRKAETVQRAALAPVDPSPQDTRVAALAQQMAARARLEIATQQRQALQEKATSQQQPAFGSAINPYLTSDLSDPAQRINQFV